MPVLPCGCVCYFRSEGRRRINLFSVEAVVALQAIAVCLVQWPGSSVTWKMSPKASFISRSHNAFYLGTSALYGGVNRLRG